VRHSTIAELMISNKGIAIISNEPKKALANFIAQVGIEKNCPNRSNGVEGISSY
jgi:hypothetical protein